MAIVSGHGIYVTGNTTPSTAQTAPTISALKNGATEMVGSRQGDAAVTADTTNGRLTLRPGRYLVGYQASFELEDISGTSGDDAGVVGGGLFEGGTLVPGSKSLSNHTDSDLIQSVSGFGTVDIAQSDVDDSTNYVDARMISNDASGNDVTVREAQLWAILLT